MIRSKLLSSGLLFAICLALSPAVASADDFAPPPWSRLHPNSIEAEWEFLTPADPAPPTPGPLTDLSNGGGTVPGGTRADIFGPSGWGGTNGGNWFFPPGGTAPRGMRFWVDDVIDFEPVKYLRVQVTSTAGLGLFIDPLAAFNVGATGSTPGPVLSSVSFVPDPFVPGGTLAHTLFTWDMFPNPPWESFILNVTTATGGGEIRQVVVDTISTHVPEPSTFVWFGIALLTVGLAFRMCPQVLKQVLN